MQKKINLNPNSSTKYDAQTNLPAWAPPSWVFAPVWVALYLLMGLALFLVLHFGNGFNRSTRMGMGIFSHLYL
jgi:tryptophan-rich sensory protein